MRPSSSPSDEAWLQALLDAEAALARALASAGVIGADDAAAIAGACDATRFDAAALWAAGAETGTPVVPLVEALRAAVGEPAARHVHRGATSQDIVDTAMMLVAKRSLTPLVTDVEGAMAAAAGLARSHAQLPAAGRTLLQHAVPVTFGLKAAGWLVGLGEARDGLRAVSTRLPAQLGGAAGTLAVLGAGGPAAAAPGAPDGADTGVAVLAAFARELDLAEPTLPWHTLRGRVGELAGVLGVTAGATGKVARDITLLAQTEVGEVAEPGGGSSTMPHKRNPVAAISALGDALQAPGLVSTLLASMVQEHERAAGAWHAEWRPFSELLGTVGSAAASLRRSLETLTVDTGRVRANLALTGDAIVSERAKWGLPADPDPAHYLGSSAAFVARALERYG